MSNADKFILYDIKQLISAKTEQLNVQKLNDVGYISEVGPHRQEWLACVDLKWSLQQVLMRACTAPQDHTPYMAPEAGSLI